MLLTEFNFDFRSVTHFLSDTQVQMRSSEPLTLVRSSRPLHLLTRVDDDPFFRQQSLQQDVRAVFSSNIILSMIVCTVGPAKAE